MQILSDNSFYFYVPFDIFPFLFLGITHQFLGDFRNRVPFVLCYCVCIPMRSASLDMCAVFCELVYVRWLETSMS